MFFFVFLILGNTSFANIMANHLGMDKSLAINSLRANGLSERSIATTLNISRNAVRRHLRLHSSKGTKVPTGSEASQRVVSRSCFESFREIILSKLQQRKAGIDHARGLLRLVFETLGLGEVQLRCRMVAFL